MSPTHPTCKAILLCDRTLLEAGTGKFSLIGVFNAFYFNEFPGVSKECEAYIQLTDALGRYEITAELRELNIDKIIARATLGGIEIHSRHIVSEIAIPIPAVPVSAPGAFDFILFANGEEIDRQKIHIIQKNEENSNE